MQITPKYNKSVALRHVTVYTYIVSANIHIKWIKKVNKLLQ